MNFKESTGNFKRIKGVLGKKGAQRKSSVSKKMKTKNESSNSSDSLGK
jgi:hypothetical protein